MCNHCISDIMLYVCIHYYRQENLFYLLIIYDNNYILKKIGRSFTINERNMKVNVNNQKQTF